MSERELVNASERELVNASERELVNASERELVNASERELVNVSERVTQCEQECIRMTRKCSLVPRPLPDFNVAC